MHRASNAFSVLQAIAATVALAIILWTVGFPSFRFADAANVTSFSDTLSTSAPGVVADHEINFITPSGVGEDGVITITFPSEFDLSAIGPEDVDLYDGGTGSYENIGVGWLVATTSNTITLTSDSGSATITAGASTTIFIGLNATDLTGPSGPGDSQIVNPATSTSYEISVDIDNTVLSGLDDDEGTTEVAIVDEVTVSASVDTQFTFTVSGVGDGTVVNGTATTTGSSSAIAIEYGELLADTASTAAQRLEVNTNASNGFVVTVVADGQLESANGAIIDGYRNGNFDVTGSEWEGPTPVLGSEETYGHWGLTSDDETLGETFTDDPYNVGNGVAHYVSASTSPIEVFRHDGPANGTNQGEGFANVAYTVEVSSLQEAANDYQATLTYVATPVF